MRKLAESLRDEALSAKMLMWLVESRGANPVFVLMKQILITG